MRSCKGDGIKTDVMFNPLLSSALSLLYHSFFSFLYLAKRFERYLSRNINMWKFKIHSIFLLFSFLPSVHVPSYRLYIFANSWCTLIFSPFFLSFSARHFNESLQWIIKKEGNWRREMKNRNEKKKRVRWIRDNVIPLIFPSFFVGKNPL